MNITYQLKAFKSQKIIDFRGMHKNDNIMTQCKIRVNLGCTEPYKGEVTNLHRELKKSVN